MLEVYYPLLLAGWEGGVEGWKDLLTQQLRNLD